MGDEDIGTNDSHLSAIKCVLQAESEASEPDIGLFDDVLATMDVWIQCKGWERKESCNGQIFQSNLRDASIQTRNHIGVLRQLITSGPQY